ncbi:hypothetical protein K9L67_02435 [Candidatus Woesearchaeota archaeon]|nr:hypothetical protein [Candidatus Woesearchaeota archaeon]MCF7901063.1 hypothetical protein [Candidatus Woesearchaeota archaeon]MCF8013614.1 hypothetical protein [Candidatus Woesearchaeota archaeon]
MNTSQIILQFVISGAVVVGATLLSKTIDSKWSGLLVALPIMTILGFIFISTSTSTAITQRYILSALIFMISSAIYILSVYLLFRKVSLVANLLISIIPLGIAAFIIQRFW